MSPFRASEAALRKVSASVLACTRFHATYARSVVCVHQGGSGVPSSQHRLCTSRAPFGAPIPLDLCMDDVAPPWHHLKPSLRNGTLRGGASPSPPPSSPAAAASRRRSLTSHGKPLPSIFNWQSVDGCYSHRAVGRQHQRGTCCFVVAIVDASFHSHFSTSRSVCLSACCAWSISCPLFVGSTSPAVCTTASAIDDSQLHVLPSTPRWVQRLAIAADIELPLRISELTIGPTRLPPKLLVIRFVDDLLPEPSLQSPRQASQCFARSLLTNLCPTPRIRPTKQDLASSLRPLRSRVVPATCPDARSFTAVLGRVVVCLRSWSMSGRILG